MVNEIFELYRKTLPEIRRNEEKVKIILNDKDNHYICVHEGGELAGVSVINENTIYLLCVAMPFRNQGIGTDLLLRSEKHIQACGFNKAILGAGKDYIMPGVPMNNNAHGFFEKRGYIHSWGDCGCFDMSQSLANFAFDENTVGDTIGGVTYRWADLSDLDGVLACVKDAAEKFVQFYQDENIYKKGNEITVLVAELAGEIVGTLHVCKEIEGKDTGSVGCTTTMQKHQGKGIASTMVILGTKHLKEIGLNHAFLGYTYTDILGMYRRAGYEVCMEYFKGEKKF